MRCKYFQKMSHLFQLSLNFNNLEYFNKNQDLSLILNIRYLHHKVNFNNMVLGLYYDFDTSCLMICYMIY